MLVLRRILVIVSSYLVSVLISSFIVIVCLAMQGFGLDARPLALNFFGVLAIGSVVTLVLSCIPAGLFIILSEIYSRPGWLGHLLGGMLTAASACVLYWMLLGFPNIGINALWFPATCIFAGGVGAITYWRLAVANALL